jgi:hypothetical protein
MFEQGSDAILHSLFLDCYNQNMEFLQPIELSRPSRTDSSSEPLREPQMF